MSSIELMSDMLSCHAYFIYRSKALLSTFAFSCILFVKGHHFLLLGVTDIADVTQYITSFPISLHTQNFTKETVNSYTFVSSDGCTKDK